MNIVLCTELYRPLLRSRLEQTCKPVSHPDLCTLAQCITCSILLLRSPLDGEAPQAGLSTPRLPQPRINFVNISAPSSVHSRRVGAAKCEACNTVLAEHVRDSQSRVTSQKQWDKGDPAHHILDWSHVEAGCWGWIVQLGDGSYSVLGTVRNAGIVCEEFDKLTPAAFRTELRDCLALLREDLRDGGRRRYPQGQDPQVQVRGHARPCS